MADDPNINEEDSMAFMDPRPMEVVLNIGNHINRLIAELNLKKTSFWFRCSVSYDLNKLRGKYLTLLERFYYFNQFGLTVQDKESKYQFEQMADLISKELEDVEKELKSATIDNITKKFRIPAYLIRIPFTGHHLGRFSVSEYKINLNIPAHIVSFRTLGMETSDFDAIHELEDISNGSKRFGLHICFGMSLLFYGIFCGEVLLSPLGRVDCLQRLVRHFSWIIFAGVMVLNTTLLRQISPLSKMNQSFEKLSCQVKEKSWDKSYRMTMQQRSQEVLKPNAKLHTNFFERLFFYMFIYVIVSMLLDPFLKYLSTHPEYSFIGLYLTAFAAIIHFILSEFVNYQEKIIHRKKKEINFDLSFARALPKLSPFTL